jgi:uncharacterized protein YeaO (DUF488 family)
VRRPPRGVRRENYAKQNWFDVWLPNLAPSAKLISGHRKTLATAAGWRRFAAQYRSEMARPENSRLLDALAVLSRHTNFSVGCYCEDEGRCHRSELRKILKKHGAEIVDA